jgi:PAS domain-containing protein
MTYEIAPQPGHAHTSPKLKDKVDPNQKMPQPVTPGEPADKSFGDDTESSSSHTIKKKKSTVQSKGKEEASSTHPIDQTPPPRAEHSSDDEAQTVVSKDGEEVEHLAVPQTPQARSAKRNLFGEKDNKNIHVVVYIGSKHEDNKLFSLTQGDDTLRFHQELTLKEIPERLKLIRDAVPVSPGIERTRNFLFQLKDHPAKLRITFTEQEITAYLGYTDSKLTQQKAERRFTRPVTKMIRIFYPTFNPKKNLHIEPDFPKAESVPADAEEIFESPLRLPAVAENSGTPVTPSNPDTLRRDNDSPEGLSEYEEGGTLTLVCETTRKPLPFKSAPSSPRGNTPQAYTPRDKRFYDLASPALKENAAAQEEDEKQEIILPRKLSDYTLRELHEEPGVLNEIKRLCAQLKIDYLNLKRKGNAFAPRDPNTTLSGKFLLALKEKLEHDKPYWFFRWARWTKSNKAYYALVERYQTMDKEWTDAKISKDWKQKEPRISTIPTNENNFSGKRELTEQDKITFGSQKTIQAFVESELKSRSLLRKYVSVFNHVQPEGKPEEAVKFNIARHNLAINHVRNFMSR